MNRSLRDLKNFPISSQHRRGLSLNGASDDHLDLFSKSRRSVSLADDQDSDVAVKLGRLSLGSVKQVKSGLEDLLTANDGGKHDYDWLLTPPGTPLVPSSEANESKPVSVTTRGSSLGRSVSTAKASRLSVSHSESNTPARHTRSNSVTRPSVSSSQYSTYSNKSGSILNTSSASVSSYIRPSTPTSRSSSTRPSTPTSRASVSRPSTPSKARQAPSTPSRPTQSSRPSTPTSRSQIPANMSTPSVRSNSRPSTPTRRAITPSLSPASRSTTPSGRSVTNGRTAASVSRPGSPSPQVRRPSQPIVPPDFSLETPPNLRTTLPDRPLSAGRSRPNPSVAPKGNTETPSAVNLPRRQSSPIASRGRLTESSSRGRVLGGGQLSDTSESRRASNVSELSTRKPVKTATDNMGLGRTISKKSLDVAIRHMDIRNGLNGVRPLSSSTLFPHSIRSINGKSQPSHGSTTPSSIIENASYHYNGNLAENGNYLYRSSENGSDEGKSQHSAKLTDIDIYESSRYDALLLKEDLKNTNWLHSIDDKSEQETIFDNGFESLPEPFSPLQHL